MKIMSQLQKKLFRFILLFILASGLWVLPSCSTTSGTSEASPVASIPLPEEGTITVSNPDSEGLSVVTGSANAVPASAIIVVAVSDYSAVNFDVPGALKNLVNPAYATTSTCSSDLPTCPTLSSDNECQFTASEDGSFVFQVPTEAGSEITLGYLNVDNSCEETVYEEAFTIDGDVLSLNMDVSSIAFPDSDEDWGLYLLGVNENGTNEVAVIDVNTDDAVSYPDIGSLPDAVGTPSQIFVDDFESYAARFVALSTSSNLYFTVYDEALGTYSSLVTVLDGNDNNSAVPSSLVVDFNAYTFTETEVATGGCSAIYTGGAGTYERAFILKMLSGFDELYVLPNISGSGGDHSALSYTPNLSYVLLDSFFTIERYLGAVEKNDYIYALAQMRYVDTSQPEHDFVAVLKFSAAQPYCDNSEFVIVDYVSIASGEAATDYYITTFDDGDTAVSNDYVVILNIDEQALSFININSTLTADTYTGLSTYTGLTHATYFSPGFLSSGAYSIFVLADDSEGTAVISYNTEVQELTAVMNLSAQYTTLSPEGAYYIETTDRVYLIDSGIADDFTTTVLSRDLSETTGSSTTASDTAQ